MTGKVWQCEDGCPHFVRISKYTDDDIFVYIDLYNVWYSLPHRIKLAWDILRGGNQIEDSIILTKESAKEMAAELTK